MITRALNALPPLCPIFLCIVRLKHERTDCLAGWATDHAHAYHCRGLRTASSAPAPTSWSCGLQVARPVTSSPFAVAVRPDV
eukprot:COSAG02_NODE_8387_length_2588_cov_44.268329_2_plen_82_part_00